MVNSLKKSFLLFKFTGVMFFFLVSCSPDSEEMSSSFEVSVSVNGNGTVSSSQFNVESNTIISISAIPNEGYYFDRWDGLNEVIETVSSVSSQMPTCVKCTGKGGLAITKTACMIKEKLASNKALPVNN